LLRFFRAYELSSRSPLVRFTRQSASLTGDDFTKLTAVTITPRQSDAPPHHNHGKLAILLDGAPVNAHDAPG
jgi:hypothetical protein